jgi:hypothetical protein
MVVLGGMAVSYERGVPVEGLKIGVRFRVNVAHVRRSRPDSGLSFQVTVLKA